MSEPFKMPDFPSLLEQVNLLQAYTSQIQQILPIPLETSVKQK